MEKVPNNNMLYEVIKGAIKAESEKLIKEAMKELEKRTPHIISGITVDIMQMTELQIMQDRIVFTIKKHDQHA